MPKGKHRFRKGPSTLDRLEHEFVYSRASTLLVRLRAVNRNPEEEMMYQSVLTYMAMTRERRDAGPQASH